MNYFVIWSILLVLFQVETKVVTARILKELKPEAEACIRDLDLDKNEIQLLDSREIVPEDNIKFNDFLGCYWQKMGWQSSNGEIVLGSVKTLFKDILANSIGKDAPLIRIIIKQILYSIIEECQEISSTGSSYGQKAVKMQNCIIKTMKDIIDEVQMRS